MPVTQMWSAGVRGCSALVQSDPTVPPRQLHTRLLKMLACRLPPSVGGQTCPGGQVPLQVGALFSHGASHTQPPSVGEQTCPGGQAPPQAGALFSHGVWQTQLPPPAVGAQTWFGFGQVPLQVGAALFSHGVWQTQLPPPAGGAQPWVGLGQAPWQV